MRKSLLISLLLLLPFSVLLGSEIEFKKSLHVAKGSSHPSSVVSMGGDIKIEGRIEKSIIMIGGHLRIDGEVKEDVICIAAKVELGNGASINGDFLVIGGALERDPLSKVKGEFFYFRFDLKKIESTLIPILSDARTITFLKIIKIIFWFILALLVLLIVPQKVYRAEDLFEKNMLKCGLVGLVSMFAFIFFLIFFIILSFLIVGILLLFVLVFFYFIVLFLGRTAMFFWIGNIISRSLKVKGLTPAILILIGAVLYGLLKFLPYMGPFILVVMNIFELGIGISFFLGRRIQLKS